MQSNYFRAPSIPKLGTRRVSSSIFGGGRRSSTPKLNVSNFSFVGEKNFFNSVKNIEFALKEIAGVVNKSTVKIDTLESKIINLDSFTKVIEEPKLIESITKVIEEPKLIESITKIIEEPKLIESITKVIEEPKLIESITKVIEEPKLIESITKVIEEPKLIESITKVIEEPKLIESITKVIEEPKLIESITKVIEEPKLIQSITKVIEEPKLIESITKVIEEPKLIESITKVIEEPKLIESITKVIEEPKLIESITKVIEEPKLIESIIIKYGELNDKNDKNDKNENNVTKTLVETNKILVEIQKQLSADFELRIQNEKEAIKNAKAAESKRKFSAKEKSVESTRKFSSFAENTVNRVTAPIKSVFDRIKEFFGLILTGIVTNAVFTWLGDEENRKKLNTIFDWVGKIFVGLLLGVIAAKFIKWGNRLFKLVRFFWRLPGRIKALFNGLRGLIGRIGARFGFKPTSIPKPKIPWWQKNAKSLSRANESYSRFISGQSNIGDRLRSVRRGLIKPTQIFTKGGAEALAKKPNFIQRSIGAVGGFFGGLTGKIAEPIVNLVLPKLPAPAKKKVASTIASKGIKRFLPFVNTAFASIEAINRLMNGDIEGALISAATAIPIAGWLALVLDIWRSAAPDHYQKNVRFGLSTEEINQAIGEGFNSFGSAMSVGGFSLGGTVPGRGSKNVDSVNAMLAPGEEVIRTTSAMMFRPLLKDINDNAGRLWDGFSRAIGKLASVSEYQKEVSKEYSKVIKDFDEYLKQEINKKKTETPSGGGGTRRAKISTEKVKQQPQINTEVSFSSQQTNVRISSSPRITNVNMTPPPSSGGGMTFLPMVLPTQKSKPPQIPTPQNTATDVPFITSVNMSNPYMQLTPEMYGIFV